MRIRFVVKKIQTGPRSFEYRVYDKQRGSFPYSLPDLGVVAQDHGSEKDAQAECDRLTAEHGYIKETAGKRKSRPTTVGDRDRDHDEDDD